MKKPDVLQLHKFHFQAMGSPCEIQIYAKLRWDAQTVAESMMAEVARLENRYSRYRNDSYLSQINAIAARGGVIDVDDETAGLLNYAATCYTQSGGLFDITSGVLRRAWDFKSGRVPSEDEVMPLLDKVGWHLLKWASPRLKFTTPGMELDFGGMVKEYAVDRLATLCQSSGIYHGVINLGGDVRVIGPHPDVSPWQVGIQHPRAPGRAAITIPLSRGGIASSGDYERCITINGVRYGHVLNPHTGWPVRHMASVSVVADFCVVAGSACTIAMLKEQEGEKWLGDMGLPHLWIDVQGNTGGSLASKHGWSSSRENI